MKPRSLDKRSWQSSSAADPDAIIKNQLNCRWLSCTLLSAILEEIDKAARRICEIKPKAKRF